MKVGFRILRERFDAHGDLRAAFKDYNGSAVYAADAMARRARYECKLCDAGFKV